MAISPVIRDRGTRRTVPKQRRMAIDIAEAAAHVPSFPVHRTMQLGGVESARRQLPSRMGWAALMASVYSRISQAIPELRDVYVPRPVPYLYRHPHPVASITVHRTDAHGVERLVWGRLNDAHLSSLDQIQSQISGFTTSPIDSFFRDGIKMEKRPWLLRKLTWRILMRWSGRRRAKHLGTFSLSNLGGWGALNAHYPLVTGTGLSMGPLQSDGCCEVVLLCDHRVIDGALAAKVLELFEHKLTTEAIEEMDRLVSWRPAA